MQHQVKVTRTQTHVVEGTLELEDGITPDDMSPREWEVFATPLMEAEGAVATTWQVECEGIEAEPLGPPDPAGVELPSVMDRTGPTITEVEAHDG